jgi:protein-disulfide isomerase
VAQVLFRHFYNGDNHKQAEQLAQATLCADAQKRFWDAHDRLFSTPAGQASVDQLVSDIGLSRPSFERCMSNHTFSQLAADRRLAETLGVLGTPTTVIGKVTGEKLRAVAVVDGAQPLGVFEAAIRRAQ